MINKLVSPLWIASAEEYMEALDKVPFEEVHSVIRNALSILGFAGHFESTMGLSVYSRSLNWSPAVVQAITWVWDRPIKDKEVVGYNYKLYLVEWKEGEYIDQKEINLKEFLEEAINLTKNTLNNEESRLRGAQNP